MLGGGDLPGRPDDAVGLVSFAGYADTAAPLTLDHENLVAVARNLAITTLREENFTAIGDALGLAVERLRESPAQSRIAVLLTDGVNNAGVETPGAAAELARSLGVKVYTIGAGSTGIAHMRVPDARRGSTLRAVAVEIDEETLRDIAERTGGLYFRASNADALADVYAEIDRLERTKITEDRSRQYEELFVAPLLAALLLAALGWLGPQRRVRTGAVMRDVVFANPLWIHAVWPALALVALLGFLELRSRDVLGRFVSAVMQPRLAQSASRAASRRQARFWCWQRCCSALPR